MTSTPKMAQISHLASKYSLFKPRVNRLKNFNEPIEAHCKNIKLQIMYMICRFQEFFFTFAFLFLPELL